MVRIVGYLRRYMLIVACLSIGVIVGCSRTDNGSGGSSGSNTGSDTSSSYGNSNNGNTNTGGNAGTTGGTGSSSDNGTTRRGGDMSGNDNSGSMNNGTSGSSSGSMSADDTQLEKRVRRAIQSDNALGTDAQNIKVTANNGTVTLRGPVSSDNLKDQIENRIKNIAGVKKVDNQLQVTNSGQ